MGYGKDKKAEEKKDLSPQQVKISGVSINDRTQALAQTLRTTGPKLCINRVEEQTAHLLAFSEGGETLPWNELVHT